MESIKKKPDLILVRYGELGLKSYPVRKKFERTLRNSIERAFMDNRIEATVRMDTGRFFIGANEPEKTMKILSRTFGIVSISPVWTTSSKIEDITALAGDLWGGVLKDGQSFAVRARRSGGHPYTSMELAKEVGSAIWGANKASNPSVNLKNPDTEFFVEVRDKKAYLFRDVMPGPGGFPIGTQGVVAVCLKSENDAAAAWLLMKRGCYLDACGDERFIEALKLWDPGMHVIDASNTEELLEKSRVDGLVTGQTIENFEGIVLDIPVFYPLIGIDDEDIKELKKRVFG